MADICQFCRPDARRSVCSTVVQRLTELLKAAAVLAAEEEEQVAVILRWCERHISHKLPVKAGWQIETGFCSLHAQARARMARCQSARKRPSARTPRPKLKSLSTTFDKKPLPKRRGRGRITDAFTQDLKTGCLRQGDAEESPSDGQDASPAAKLGGAGGGRGRLGLIHYAGLR